MDKRFCPQGPCKYVGPLPECPYHGKRTRLIVMPTKPKPRPQAAPFPSHQTEA